MCYFSITRMSHLALGVCNNHVEQDRKEMFCFCNADRSPGAVSHAEQPRKVSRLL